MVIARVTALLAAMAFLIALPAVALAQAQPPHIFLGSATEGGAPVADGVQRGGYVLWEASAKPDVVLIGTGSEVHIALEAGLLLQDKGVMARVVSLPSWELFDAQPVEYRDSVLPPDVRARVSIEAATSMGWERYVGLDGVAMGISHFGASAPIGVLYEKFGLTAQRMAEEAACLAARNKR